MSDGSSTGRELDSAQASDARADALKRELIEASGNYGLHAADKLRNATTLLGLSAVGERASQERLSVPEAALRVVKDTVDAWPDPRGCRILRSAFGFDHGSWGSRPNRLGLLAVELGEANNAKHSKSLDTAFTEWLARDLAAGLLAGEPPAAALPTGQHEARSEEQTAMPHRYVPLFVAGAIALVLFLGIGTFLLFRDEDLVFRPIPSRCSIDYCRDQLRAIVAQTDGFTPGGVVRTEIFTPSGKNANELGGLATYRDEKPINQDGQFIWWYWWDSGMEIGTYHARITDEETGSTNLSGVRPRSCC